MEKLAQLNPQTGLGPLSKSRSKPFEPKVRTRYNLCEGRESNCFISSWSYNLAFQDSITYGTAFCSEVAAVKLG